MAPATYTPVYKMMEALIQLRTTNENRHCWRETGKRLLLAPETTQKARTTAAAFHQTW